MPRPIASPPAGTDPQPHGLHKPAFVALVVASVIVLDQLTKYYVRANMPLHDNISVIDGFFSIIHASNTGGAFSFLAGARTEFRVPFFLIAATIAICVLVYFLWQIPSRQRWLLFAVSGVLGGALGNLIDRVTFGHVTDFLLVYWRDYHWPAFNVADSFITVGIVILIANSLFGHDEHAAV